MEYEIVGSHAHPQCSKYIKRLKNDGMFEGPKSWEDNECPQLKSPTCMPYHSLRIQWICISTLLLQQKVI